MLIMILATIMVQQMSSVKVDSSTNEIDLRPQCKDSEDLVYANCYNLKKMKLCEIEKKKMQFYCPVTCRQCKGPIDENRVSGPPVPKCMTSRYGCCNDNETAAQGENYLGCPERCYDTPNYSCDFFRKIGFCNNGYYKMQMLLRCPLSCNYCKNTVKKNKCRNLWSDRTCDRAAKHNFCTVMKHEKRLNKNCRKSCGKCKNNAPALMSVARECSQEGTCCWDRSKPINGRCPDCADRYAKSFCKIFSVDCTDTSGIKGVQIRVLCAQTCGFCSVPKTCTDDLIYGEFCDDWKERGQCEKQPVVMRTYCKKTCGFCFNNNKNMVKKS